MAARKKPTATAASVSAPAAAKTAGAETKAEKIETTAPVTGDVADRKATEDAKSVAVVGAANIAINSSLETKPDNGESGEQVEVIFVRSRPKHFYRAGFKFTEKVKDIAISELSEAQLEAIRLEPNLFVEDGSIAAGDAE
jgi:hypothetical protein